MKRPSADAWALAAAELGLLFGALTLVTGPLWARKAWGVWWVWDPRLTSSLMLFMIFAPTCCCGNTAGPGRSKLGCRHGAVRHGQRAVHLRVGERLAHASSADVGGADAADRHGHSAVVLFCRVHDAVPGAADACAPARISSARVSKRCILPRTKHDAIPARVRPVAWRSLAVDAAGRCGHSRSRPERVRAGGRHSAGRADSGDHAGGGGLRLRLGRACSATCGRLRAPAARSKPSSPNSNPRKR